ncbi:bifunctional (p)ppGpp synthetase/guanosine-3',5'-bis(diphosphate) 3'-pyrophosphohydrolase [Clostridium sp. D2Q-11]|uniref:GTP diphosphokinase n=1 Tax=Anaeromonas frigoriresistens TaxID=2683708 RepID=A0A942Z7L7_9FIRM|nr:bifunctional (p)ppGpp synthetase/guanosine-3',5'-bis(diphosphate) 3'-pyrophosphohydrolase [Anaeromonas frigoriresistens]MBS4539691.1 bifunctional (p)ppGpp synthetase/guanosine-3',5'-bis(diphosphate) 3'-pyrophosphohydrolase [Anaeromonas frigoriresistens]
MSLERLLDKIKQYNPQGDLEKVEKAFYFAKSAHEGQLRNSGEEFFIHPVNVAMILADINMDINTIVAGLLHDVIEDTENTYDNVMEEFGEEVANLVDGVTKLKKIKYSTKEERLAENLRKMVIAMAKDIRVIIIKLTDRLHNMRTLEYMSDEKKKEKALETLEIYAPIANRLGIFRIKWELEDISLRYIDPEGYYDLVDKVSKKRKEREEYINQVIEKLKVNLDDVNIECEISGRPKHFYSIYRKMVYQNKVFEQIFDLTAIRVIVDSVKDCYGALGIVHTLWKPIPGRFKDYIAMPKPNMYQSLHTTLIGPNGETFEIQIRTWDMHRTAEYGIAAHWKYKEGNTEDSDFDKKLTWLRQMLEWQKEMKDPKEFMESLRIDLFNNEVFVFTPKGDVINLPAGSTPIDFAYRVHTAVGNTCVGAKVNGRIVPLDYKLKNGNIVTVLTSPNSNGPSRDWLKIVKSSHAKSKIKQWYKKEERSQNIIKGKDKLEKDIKRQGYKITEILKEEWLERVADKLSFSNVDDLYAALGYGNISLAQITTKLKEYHKEYYKISDEEEHLNNQLKIRKNKKPVQGVKISGIDNVKVRFAKCCNPVPGDDIKGYITRGRGVSVHRSDCPNILDLGKDQRFIEVDWDTEDKVSYQAEIQVKGTDRPGLLSEVTKLLSDANLLVSSLNARTNKEKLAIVNLTLEIKDVEQLNDLIKKLKRIKGVIDVYRVIT